MTTSQTSKMVLLALVIGISAIFVTMIGKFLMAVLLGGRAAEHLVFEHFSTGAADDLSKATQIARSMVTQYGMNEEVGHASYESESSPFLGPGAAAGGGLCSYPHPRSMPDFWQMPNASMGLSTPSAIYQARFAKYLENRGLKTANGGKFWCFIGDGESDEPEVLGSIGLAGREELDNLHRSTGVPYRAALRIRHRLIEVRCRDDGVAGALELLGDLRAT